MTTMIISGESWVRQEEYDALLERLAKYQALESAAQRVMICTNWLTRNDRDYLVDKAAINAIKTALAALDAGEREDNNDGSIPSHRDSC